MHALAFFSSSFIDLRRMDEDSSDDTGHRIRFGIHPSIWQRGGKPLGVSVSRFPVCRDKTGALGEGSFLREWRKKRCADILPTVLDIGLRANSISTIFSGQDHKIICQLFSI
jgi:hypothetical protein